MTAQLALVDSPAPLPAAVPEHRWQGPEGATLGLCVLCGRAYLDRIHHGPSRGTAAFFDALDRVDRDAVARARETLEGRRDDLLALAASDRHAEDERFRSGLAWGLAALNLVEAALDGVSDPARLRFHDISRP